MIEALRESIAHLLHTLEGSRIAMHCIWFGTKKVKVIFIGELAFRRNYVKAFITFIIIAIILLLLS